MIRRLLQRNLRLYFRDHISVFFSLLAVLIVLVLYILFLADLSINMVSNQMNNMVDRESISYLINSWILAGLLSITSVTSTIGGLAAMVRDREYKLIADFKSAPIRRYVYVTSMISSAFIIGTIISLISLAIYGAYISITTAYGFTFIQYVKAVLVIMLSSAMNACLMGLIVSFFKTGNAFSGLSLMVGSTIGFLNGLYVPMGSLPSKVQTVVKCLPFGHVASVLRKIIMKESLDMCESGAGADAVNGLRSMFGVDLLWGGKVIKTEASLIFVMIVLAVSMVLLVINYGRKYEEI
ncbi:MAG: ABC transporter permease [Lachnospiraceae bacterium]|nr:ABC transporter permease [Lachnospiraceae bacterium]MCR4678441.1 ABC transporter permease [Lachnospiraceae bacterium]